MSLFDEDPAADFLKQEQESLGDVLGGQFEVVGEQDVKEEQLDFLAAGEAPAALLPEPDLVEPDTSPYSALKEAAEPESIRKWKAEQAEQIAVRDAEAEAKRKDWKEEAAKDLDDWNTRQNDVLSKNKVGNREAQDAMIADQQDSKPGQQWEKICKLCDFNPKNNRNAKDTARMRSIFLQLKQSPLVR